MIVSISQPGAVVFLPFGESAPTLNLTIDWGDSNIQEYSSAIYNADLLTWGISHQYAASSGFTIRLSRVGDAAGPVWLSRFGWGSQNYGWSSLNYVSLQSVASFGDLGIVSLEGCFLRAPTNFGVPSDIPRTVTSLRSMFFMASTFNQPIGTWNVSAVTDMFHLFYRAATFNQPIGEWDVSSVTNMFGTFYVASAFNQPIGSWNTRSVRSMNYMFSSATSFNQPIGAWDVRGVYDMSFMFYYAPAFNQPLQYWCVPQFAYRPDYFTGAWSVLESQNEPAWGTCPQPPIDPPVTVVVPVAVPVGSTPVAAAAAVVSSPPTFAPLDMPNLTPAQLADDPRENISTSSSARTAIIVGVVVACIVALAVVGVVAALFLLRRGGSQNITTTATIAPTPKKEKINTKNRKARGSVEPDTTMQTRGMQLATAKPVGAPVALTNTGAPLATAKPVGVGAPTNQPKH